MKSFYNILYTILLLLYLSHSNIFAQEKCYQIATLAFYNVENLFDTINSVDRINGNLGVYHSKYHTTVASTNSIKDSLNLFKKRYTFYNLKNNIVYRDIRDEDFTPKGKNGWNSKRYYKKLENISKVISEIGYKDTKTAPVAIGLCEIENQDVLIDLVNTPALKPYNYGIVHYNSFDERGIDVAFLYQKNRFEVITSKRFILEIFDNEGKYRDYTRDQLLIKGKLDGETLYIIVNHWPSRSGGEKKSQPKREAAAKLNLEIIKEIQNKDPNAKIITMGDFNDDPNSPSIKTILKAQSSKNNLKSIHLYNPMYKLNKKGIGSLAWRDNWNIFDQIIVSRSLINKNYTSYKMYKAGVYNPYYLQQADGLFKGYPYRTFSGGIYTSGYSDHFPVYLYLIRKLQ